MILNQSFYQRSQSRSHVSKLKDTLGSKTLQFRRDKNRDPNENAVEIAKASSLLADTLH